MYEGFDKLDTNLSLLTCYVVGDNRDIRTVEECNIGRICLQFKKAEQRHQYSDSAIEIAHFEIELR
jgi:hypothetical protein